MILKREKEKNIGKESQTICGICSWGQMDSKDALPFSEKNCLCLCIFEKSVEWGWGHRDQDGHEI